MGYLRKCVCRKRPRRYCALHYFNLSKEQRKKIEKAERLKQSKLKRIRYYD